MKNDQYKRIKEVFQSVLDAPAEHRSSLLDERCGDDRSMRDEVERLLNLHDSGYLENPAIETVASTFGEHELRPGERIEHYTIVNKIGSGGMGDVYLTEDGKLGRRVAIKLLPEMFTDDRDRLTRFQREARAVSALNHPNILTIHEIGETDSMHYIATEYIDGETLRSKLNRERIEVGEALDIAVQCASALAAAHEEGIIHRDIKPENIMLRRDNLVKVLDFGLAKLSGRKGVSVSDQAETELHLQTAPGMIMGTVQYMSPEQTRGHATDARTDIWSLGCVIYEMVAGKPAFAGENTADLIAEIVKSQPAPLPRSIDDRLDEIVSKTLEKNPDERYQTAKDLLIDLKRLKRKLDHENEVRRQSPSTKSGNAPHGGDKPRITAEDVGLTNIGTRNTVSSAEYIVGVIKRNYVRTAVASVITVAMIGAVSYTVYRWSTGGVRSDALIVYAGKIKLVAQALNSSNYSQAKQLLDETKPRPGEEDVRGFEWGYLANSLAEASTSQPLSLSAGSGVDAVAFSPDGKMLATGGLNNLVRLWDVGTGNEVRSLAGHTAMVTFVAFSPDGRTLLTTGFDATARAWDVATGQPLFALHGVARFSADGSAVVVPNGRDMVFHDAVTGVEKSRFTNPVEPGAFLFSPDGKYLAVRGHDQVIHILDATDKRSVSTIKGHSGWVMDFEFSPNSNSLVTASKDRTAKLWDVRSGKEIRTFEGHVDEIFEVEFSPDGTTIATGSNDHTTRLWDAEKGFEIARLRSDDGNVIGLAYSPDGSKLASSGDNTVRVWNASGLRKRGILRGHSKPITRVTFSPSGRTLVSSSEDKTARVWEVESERELITLSGHDDSVHTAIFSSDGDRIATVSEDKKIKLWDSKTGRELVSIDSLVPANNLAISPDGMTIVTGHWLRDPMIRFWDLTSGRMICETRAHEYGPWSIGITPDDRVVTAAFDEATISIWDRSTCAEISSFQTRGANGNFLWFGPNNSWRALQILNDGRSLTWFEPETGRALATFSGHDAILADAKFTPDGRRLVTAEQGGMIRIWDSATGLELLSFDAVVGDETLAISPDGKTLAVGGNDGTIRLYRSSFVE